MALRFLGNLQKVFSKIHFKGLWWCVEINRGSYGHNGQVFPVQWFISIRINGTISLHKVLPKLVPNWCQKKKWLVVDFLQVCCINLIHWKRNVFIFSISYLEDLKFILKLELGIFHTFTASWFCSLATLIKAIKFSLTW